MTRRLAIFVAGCAGLLFCIFVLDKPIASLGWAAVGHTQFRGAVDYNALTFFKLLGVLLLLCCRLRNLLLAAVAGAVALAVNLAFKNVFGRSSSDPAFFHLHQYGFHFFHATENWSSFPSGTVAVGSAVLLVLVQTRSLMRMPAIVFGILICGVIILENAHWLSDVLAGAALGMFIGEQTLAHLGPFVGCPTLSDGPIVDEGGPGRRQSPPLNPYEPPVADDPESPRPSHAPSAADTQ